MGTQREAEEFVNLIQKESLPDLNFSAYKSRSERTNQMISQNARQYNNFQGFPNKNNQMGNFKNYNG